MSTSLYPADFYANRRAHTAHAASRIFAALPPDLPRASVADIGCGTGTFLAASGASYQFGIFQKRHKKFEKLFKNEIAGLEINNLTTDLTKINMDESNKARNTEFIKDLKKDIYLEETMYIIRDMINLEKSFVSQQKKILE